jgi:hypothetical protein
LVTVGKFGARIAAAPHSRGYSIEFRAVKAASAAGLKSHAETKGRCPKKDPPDEIVIERAFVS